MNITLTLCLLAACVLVCVAACCFQGEETKSIPAKEPKSQMNQVSITYLFDLNGRMVQGHLTTHMEGDFREDKVKEIRTLLELIHNTPKIIGIHIGASPL